jgi:AcrR family transcriptional regulator
MSPRPRTMTDDAILGATHRAMARLGPVRFTLAEVAREAGLSAATLVQRFGSKRGLLLALATGAAGSVDACFDELRAQHPSPLAALIAAATFMTRHTTSPEELANHLAFLQNDLTDPEFHRLTLDMSTRHLAAYRALLTDAIAAGELVTCDTARLARAIGAISGGSLIAWAIHREGTAEHWVKEDLATLLAPYRPARRRTRTKRSASKRTPAQTPRPRRT